MGSFKLCLAVVFVCVVTFTSLNPTCANDSPQDYLDAHNKARAHVRAGLLPFSWDRNLEAYARNYSHRALKHNTCDQLVHSKGPYGENLGSGGPDYTGVVAVHYWVAEKANYSYRTNSCVTGQMCGHYTQVVWRDSVRLGCARVLCTSINRSYVICSYDPPGNYVGQRPY